MSERIYVSLTFPRLQKGMPVHWCNRMNCWYFKNADDYAPYSDYMDAFRLFFINIPDEQVSCLQSNYPSLFYDKSRRIWLVNHEDLQKILDLDMVSWEFFIHSKSD